MRKETTIRTLYKFEELSEESQERALDKLRDIITDFADWHDAVFDDAKECARILGIEIDTIYYSGFWSQGDGACFEGSYSYKKGAVKAIKEHAPEDKELHGIAERLQAIQRPAFYGLSASVVHRGQHYHELCTSIDVGLDCDAPRYATAEEQDSITEELRSFMQWIYSRLESEYEYLTSDDAIRESIDANEYEFTENGELA